ncbi:PEP-CTERM sorting domain-containing protein [Paraglaciecola sp. 25GB23A]|uniref:PEP-CTERM sorting domain-containing protein n=1 Tax=Paraglaciecola sp. 25GB23A TaxID=3156068 RepID=UPI0032AF59E3
MKNLLMFLVLSTMSLNIQATLLSDLINGQSITAGDKLFDQWAVLFEDSSDFTSVNTDNIVVTALNDGGLNPGPGLRFDILNDELLVEGDGIFAYLDFMFGFRVTVLDPGLLVKDNSLYLTDAELVNPTSSVSVFIEEKIFTDASASLNIDDYIGIKDVELSNVFGTETDKAFDSAAFNPRNSIYVTKNILMEAWDVGESANLLSFEQRFSQVESVPEPASLWMLAVGLVMIGVRRKRLF